MSAIDQSPDGRPGEQASFSPLRFDSAALPVDLQFPTFASGMANFDLSRENEGAFAVCANVWRIGGLVVTEVCADAATYERGMQRIRADQTDHVYLNFHVAGGVRVDVGQGMRRAGAASLLVIDMRQPCRMAADARQAISIAAPRHLLLPRLEPFDPHGLIATDGLVPLLGATLQAVCASLPVTPKAQAAAIERLILDLVVDALLGALRSAGNVSLREEALLTRLRAFLDAHLDQPLDVGAICRGLGVSRSSLYRVSGGGGGVLRLLQQRRLRRLRALLEDSGETRPVATLAQVVGFRDPSHASRAFKQAYGLSPNEFRTARLRADAPQVPANDAARLFRSWIRGVS